MPVDTRQSHYGGEEGPMLKRGYSIKYRRIYKIWQGIRQRCNNPNDKDYEDYGGRGIRVCEEWDKSSEAFVRWALENGYADNLSIDRIDTNSGYSPENCRWSTKKEQAHNRKSTHFITRNGETHNITEWAKILGVKRSLLLNRLYRGWDEQEIFDTRKYCNQYERRHVEI